MHELTADVALEAAGEEDLSDVVHLIVRNSNIHDISAISMSLVRLQTLSLSHNQLGDLRCFTVLTALRQLNLNNNALTSLEGLQNCLELESIYACNNRIVCLRPLGALQALSCVSLVANAVTSMVTAMSTLEALPVLRELDLLGNPVAAQRDYKHFLVTRLPFLRCLDGDTVSAVDLDLAEMFFHQENGAVSKPSKELSRTKNATADADTVDTDRLVGERKGQLLVSTVPGHDRPSSCHASSPRPPAAKALFKDSQLNGNPILLEYLVDMAVRPPPTESLYGQIQSSGESSSRTTTPQLIRNAKRSFVDRLRNSAAVMGACQDLPVSQVR